MRRDVQVCTPCRLHFGMFSFGQADRAQYGGVGVMAAPPCVKVIIRPAGRFIVGGSLAERVREFVERAVEHWGLGSLPACEIAVESPPNHVGLGVGTQLALAVAAGLRRFFGLADVSVEEFAMAVGRGARSAVGTYGFKQGGLIVDAGKIAGETMGRLCRRVELPDGWRFVLVCRKDARGLAGSSESGAFARLPPVPLEVTDELWAITREQMLPAVEQQDCGMFGESVYRFGRLAGESFSAVQGGPFANAEIARLVKSIRDFGVPGVGQSSWGPMVFAVTENEEEARRLVEWLGRTRDGIAYEITVARPNNTGAEVR